MRLFIAAELPDNMIEALAETSARLRGCVRGRYVAPDSYHVTLAFLGDIEGARIEQVAEALDGGCREVAAFNASFGELGSFGRRAKAVLWQGFQDAGALPASAQEVRAELGSRGFTFDDKAFLPHVTFMRAADLTAGIIPAPALASGKIETITLFSSDLSSERPVYEPLHSAWLD